MAILRNLLACACLLLSGTSAAAPPAEPRRYAVIIGANEALDEGLAPLAYAVDDAAKHHALFLAAGASTELLASFGTEAARRHPTSAAVAVAPRRAEVFAAIGRVFEQIRLDTQSGRETHFYLVYTGHGGLGPNREGYLNLADARLTRTELYREVLARSPASFNHLILDACHAYYLVLKRGGAAERDGDFRSAVRQFLLAEELANHPNTGVILASSASSETHEWGQWEAGIFSHELRSALLGPADVNEDGAVTYAEAAAFVEAANAAIDVPKARLRVFFRPPLARPGLPLFDLTSLKAATTLEIAPEHAGRFHVEDAKGVRVADFHPSAEQTMRVALLGEAPFWIRSSLGAEALLPAGPRVRLAQLELRSAAASTKGSVDLTFRRNLFQIPFGISYFAEATAERARLAAGLGLQEREAAPPASLRPKAVWGWSLVGAAAVVGAAGATTYGMARWSHDRYAEAKTRDEALRYRAMTEDRLLASRILAGVASAAGIAGVALLIVDWRAEASMTVQLLPGPSGPTAVFSGRF